MALMGLLDRILDSVDNAADATVAATESKVDLIVKLTAILVAAIVLLILFAIDGTLALGLVALLIVAMWLLDIDIGGSSNDSGPRR